MRCKKIRVNKCAYRVKTIIKDINGIPQEKVSNYEEVVEEKDLSELGKINGHIVI